jgi:ABC-type taurine transport system substrate-binding protein
VTGLAGAAFGSWEVGQAGDWAAPDLEHLVHLMRWCTRNPEVAAETGRRAAAWIAANLTWERTARGLLDVMREA